MNQDSNSTSAKRKQQRLRTVLPIRIFGLDSAGKPFTDIAHTLDISPMGARVGGIKHQLAIGDVVGVQRGLEKARFRVCWLGAPKTRCQDQVGLQCVQPEKCIWPSDVLALKSQDDFIPPIIPPDGPTLAVSGEARECDRRTDARFACNFGAVFEAENSGSKSWARCTDLSSGGCYLQTRAPLPPGTRFRLRIMRGADVLEATCLVRTSHPEFGMGVHFEFLSSESQAALDHMLNRLCQREPSVERGTEHLPQPGSGLKTATAFLCDRVRHFESEIQSSNVPASVQNALRNACEQFRDSLAEITSTAERGQDFSKNLPLLSSQQIRPEATQ